MAPNHNIDSRHEKGDHDYIHEFGREQTSDTYGDRKSFSPADGGLDNRDRIRVVQKTVLVPQTLKSQLGSPVSTLVILKGLGSETITDSFVDSSCHWSFCNDPNNSVACPHGLAWCRSHKRLHR